MSQGTGLDQDSTLFQPLTRLSNLLFPHRCTLCLARLAVHDWWCKACRRDLPWITTRCSRCGIPLSSDRTCGDCLKRPPNFQRAIAPLRYEAPVDRLVQQFKYRRNLALTRPLVDLMTTNIQLTEPEILLPVPLHPQRLRSRGYNQALELGRVLSNKLGIPLDTDSLRRTRATTPQAELPAPRRRANLHGAFSVTKPVCYRRVAVIDDVMTSGATVEEIARVLQQAGVGWVEVWVLARA